MTRPRASGFVHSVQERLRNEAEAAGRPFTEVVELYAVERFLHRLGSSAHRDRFVLKGAHLLRIWLGTYTRPTRDVDLYGPKSADSDRLREELVEILTTDVADDAIEFDLKSLSIRPIRNHSEVLGLRAKLDAYLARMRIRFQIDVGLGDAVFPSPEPETLDGLLDLPVAPVRAYTPYTSVAEKLEAMMVLGMANTRMKDYYDLMTLSAALSFDGPTVVEAIRRTFGRRSTPIPPGVPEGLSDKFGTADAKTSRWRTFLAKSRLEEADRDLERVVRGIREFALPPLGAASSGNAFEQAWPPEGPWKGFGRDLERRHREGYERHLVEPGEFDAWEDEQVWPD